MWRLTVGIFKVACNPLNRLLVDDEAALHFGVCFEGIAHDGGLAN
jgi:hypothetical protein